jgi:hypothetical protein
MLSFGGGEINHILDYLYPALANKIQQQTIHSLSLSPHNSKPNQTTIFGSK